MNLGVMLGVYLPTIQHILGVTMFIRLFWVVGVAGILHTFLLLALCCACVSFFFGCRTLLDVSVLLVYFFKAVMVLYKNFF